MTVDDIQALYEGPTPKYSDLPPSATTDRPDLRAFILLSLLVPGVRDIVAAAEHDKFYPDITLAELAANPDLKSEDIQVLRACGVLIDEDTESFFVFA